MKNKKELFLSVLKAFETEDVAYILIGGFAVVLHGSPRFTEDIDVLIKRTEDNIKKLRKALDSIFKDESINEITSSEIDKYAVIRYSAENDFYIDVIGNLGEAFSYENIESEEIEIEGIKIKIATVESLYRLKEKTYRAVDQGDLLFLKEKLNKKNDKEV